MGVNFDAGLTDTPSAFEQEPTTDPNHGQGPYDRNVTNLYDPLDPDTGGNNENNMPVLEPTVIEGNRAHVKGQFNSLPNQTTSGTEPNATFVIDFYVNSTVQPKDATDTSLPSACDPVAIVTVLRVGCVVVGWRHRTLRRGEVLRHDQPGGRHSPSYQP